MARGKDAVKAGLRKAVGVLPAPRDEAARRALGAIRDVATGRTPPAPAPRPRKRQRYGGPIGPKVPPGAQVDADSWNEPPVSEKRGVARALYTEYAGPGTGEPVFTVDLLEQLNEEYRDKPIVPQPRAWTSQALGAAAKKRVLWAHDTVDLLDKTVLEVGCGNGYEVWSMAHNLGCDAYGVDVQQPRCWEDLEGDRVHLQCVDMTETPVFADDLFDRVVSYTVWEHVHHPYQLLEETFRVMKPGGLQFLRANLWPGMQASHRYRDIYFPWPHHLFSDDVINAWDLKHGRKPKGSSWVNKLTWHHYERYFHRIGFKLRSVSFTSTPIDEEFYSRFEDVLGRIPRWDLERDFFTAVLEKPVR